MARIQSFGLCLISLLVLGAAAGWAQPNGNSPDPVIPTLDVVGLVALAGGLAAAGAYVAVRRNRKP
jgi:hypothetical protein